MTFVGNWLETEDDALREMWAHGETANAIGRHLDRSKNSVIGRSHRLKLDARKSPIRPRDPNAPPPVRLPVFRLPTLPSLRKPAYNALQPPPEETRELVVRLLTNGRSNVATVEASGLNIRQVRKIRKTIEIPKRERAAPPPRETPLDKPRQHSSVDYEFRTRTRENYAEYGYPGSGREKFLFGKAMERHKLAGNIPTSDDIAAFIARHGVTQCPTAAVAVTTAAIPPQDSRAVAAHQQARDEEWLAERAHWNKKRTTEAAAAKRAVMFR